MAKKAVKKTEVKKKPRQVYKPPAQLVAESESVSTFAREHLRRDLKGEVLSDELFKVYKEHARKVCGIKPVSKVTLGIYLANLGFKVTRHNVRIKGIQTQRTFYCVKLVA